MTKTVLWGLAAGMAAGTIAWVYGLQGIRPILIAIGVVVVAVAFRGFENAAYRPWPRREPLVVGGGTSTVARLSDRMRRHSDRHRGPDPGITHLLRRLVAVRLAHRGLAPTDPRADDLLGPGVRHALLADGVPDKATVAAILTTIERLDHDLDHDRDQGADA